MREHGLAARYDLADALERAGQQDRALACWSDLEFDAASYRDVAERLARLTRTLGSPRLMALLLAALFVEVGFVLLVVPWSVLWDRNYFIDVFPQLHALLTSNYVRGAVSGLGVRQHRRRHRRAGRDLRRAGEASAPAPRSIERVQQFQLSSQFTDAGAAVPCLACEF